MVGRQHRGVSSGFDHDERRGGIGRGTGPGTGTEKRRETDVDVCMMLDFSPTLLPTNPSVIVKERYLCREGVLDHTT
jgi:hypothetical protein